jgi:two-component system chemotaxis response regulator CheY
MVKCLVVDDSEVIRYVTKKILDKLGHETLMAESASDALAVCAEDMPDVVFLDWDMPGMDALGFLKGTEAMGENKPRIVLCATENDAKQFALARAAGAEFHLLKPYDIQTIRGVICQMGFDNDEPEAAAS